MTDDPLAYLHAAHAAAEAGAEAARGGSAGVWSVDAHPHYNGCRIEDDRGEVVVYDEGSPTPEQAAHMARHDPAAVLRRIAGDRKILAAHPITKDVRDIRITRFGCRACHMRDDRVDGRGYCDTLIALAEGWEWTGEAT